MNTYEVFNNEGMYIEKTGTAEAIREWMEEKLSDVLDGLFVMLQERDDEDEFTIYLHTENEEDLDDQELEHLASLGLEVHKDTASQEAILRLLNVSVR